MEYLDIVDENDCVIGKASFDEVRSKGLRRRTVNIIVARDKSLLEILIAKRSARQVSSPNKWHVSAGGHVDSGETYIEAGYREMREELFANQTPPVPPILSEIARYLNDVPAKRKFENTCLLYAVHPGPFTVDNEEIEEVRWVNPEEVVRESRRLPEEYTATLKDAIVRFEEYRSRHGV